MNIPSKQRALVLQGGGALGAYNVGVFEALYDKFKTNNDGHDSNQLFDIVAGTSSGAMNAAIIVSGVIEQGWDYALSNLKEFWNRVSTDPYIQNMPGFSTWWTNLHNMNPNAASEESARRYYSAKQFLFTGVPNVFYLKTIRPDNKFFDETIPWYVYDNQPLKNTLGNYAKFPIATSFDKNQPRLLLTSVDVQEGATVTFDSYVKEDGTRKSEYDGTDGKHYIINYDQGIDIEFAIASGSVAINYDYAKINANVIYENKNNDGSSNTQIEERCFWDGGILNNTPLREVIQSHQDYWSNINGKDNPQIPDLDVYIVDLWPAYKNKVPMDHDGVIDRYFDLLLNDKTDYDQKVANIVSDYIDFVEKTRDLAIKAIDAVSDTNKKDKFQKQLETILKTPAKTTHRTGEPRKYKDLLNGRFNINVTRIDRTDNSNDIANELFDYSTATINQLRHDGYSDTIKVIQK